MRYTIPAKACVVGNGYAVRIPKSVATALGILRQDGSVDTSIILTVTVERRSRPPNPFPTCFLNTDPRDYYNVRYVGTPSLTMAEEERLAGILDEAPRPYTVGEMASLSGLPTVRIRGWLVRNEHYGYVSSRERGRITSGKPVAEYWRGTRTVRETFGTDLRMGAVRIRILGGERPVSWTDSTRTVYSIDRDNTLAVQKGSYTAPIGPVGRIEDTGNGVRIGIEGGPVLTFGGSDRWRGRSAPGV